jgi:hypothetical protein
MKRAALGAVIASTALLLSGCGFGPIAMDKNVELIYQVDFSQSQAVPDFDDSEYSFDDLEYPEWLDSFIQLLQDHDIEPWTYEPRDSGGCTGGITTTVHMLYHGAGEDTMVIDGCAAEEGSFEADATALFSQFREAHHAQAGFANADIVSLTFSQFQSLPEFDTSEHTQDDPQQVARFVGLLDENGVVWSEGIDPSLAADPCPGSITTDITAHYTGTDVVVGPVQVGGCSDIAFVDEVTALFSEWRVTS